MKKMVLQLETNKEKVQKKAMTKVAGLPGLKEVDLNAKEAKLTAIGYIDPVQVMDKVEKICDAHIVSLGPEKEEKKKEEQPKQQANPTAQSGASFPMPYVYLPPTTAYPPPTTAYPWPISPYWG